MSRQNPRPERSRKHGILIQCEGSRTEPRYLYEFCQDCGATQRFNVKVRPGVGKNAVVTVRAAIEAGKEKILGEKVYKEVWCVLDVEHATHQATLNEAVALAAQHNITLVLSNPSFEVWLIGHFERVMRWFADGDAAVRYLSETCWRSAFGCSYDKADPKLYQRLKPLRDAAVANAQWVLEEHDGSRTCRDVNASTKVYRLIQRLLPPE